MIGVGGRQRRRSPLLRDRHPDVLVSAAVIANPALTTLSILHPLATALPDAACRVAERAFARVPATREPAAPRARAPGGPLTMRAYNNNGALGNRVAGRCPGFGSKNQPNLHVSLVTAFELG